ARAAAAEDARPARRQPGQIAPEHLLGAARVGEFDPPPGDVQGGLRGGLHLSDSRAERVTSGTCGWVCSMSAPTQSTYSSSTRARVPSRYLRTATRPS